MNALVIKFEASLNNHFLQLSYVAFYFKRTDWDNELVRTKSPSLSIDDNPPGSASIICLPNSPPPLFPPCLAFHDYMFKNLRTSPVKIRPTIKIFLHGVILAMIFSPGNVNEMICYRSLHNYQSP